MSDEEARFGEIVNGEQHFPRYRKGCWGAHNVPKCWICKFRAPVKFLRLVVRLFRER